jgi:hypothetical protein
MSEIIKEKTKTLKAYVDVWYVLVENITTCCGVWEVWSEAMLFIYKRKNPRKNKKGKMKQDLSLWLLGVLRNEKGKKGMGVVKTAVMVVRCVEE